MEEMEQPSLEKANVSEQIENIYQGTDTTDGSTYGKFKDATSLLEAYQSLEKEFTRKSQKLSELQKVYEQSGVEKTQIDDKTNENVAQNLQNDQEIQKPAEKSAENNKPIYLQSDWQSRVRQFFNQNPSAKEYSKDIAMVIMKDKALSSNSNCLEYAYAVAKQKRPAEKTFPKITDQDRQQIIREYLLQLKDGKNNLRLISGEASSSAVAPNPDKPKSIKEASLILQKLLQK